MAAFTIILFTFAILFFIIYLYKSTRRHKNFPPGPPKLPIWGSYWYLLKENYYFVEKSLQKLCEYYNTNILGFYLGSYPTIVTNDHALCKEVLSRKEFIGRTDTVFTRGRSSGELLGMFFIEQQYWKEQKTFSLRYLRDYGFGRRFDSTEELFEREVKDLIEMMASEPKPEDNDICRKKGQILSPDIFYAPALQSILHMLISKRCDNKKSRDIGRSIMKFLSVGDGTGNTLAIMPWLRFIAPNLFGYTTIMESHEVLIDFFKEYIFEHNNNFSDDHLGDFTDVFLNQMKQLENENKFDTVFTEKHLLWVLIDYMFPAPTTIAQTLNYIFGYLLNYPEIQDKIHEEIDRVVGRSRLPNLDDRQRLPYTEAVIRETFRKNPLNPLGIPRRCVEDTTLAGYFIPKDTVILPGIESAHHDPKVWDDPHSFKPERFINSDGSLLKQDLTMTFGGGVRLCVGETFARQRIFLILTGLLQNFTFKSVGKIPDLNKKNWGIAVTLKPIWLEAVSR